ncbi:MAG: iron ABC transporter permease [Bacteroidales bacterium]|nr:iron ABC transporter permease [Bacteroidales bacterium]
MLKFILSFFYKYSTFFFVALILLLSIIDLLCGQVVITFKELFEFMIFKLTPNSEQYQILYNIRLPRVINAISAGLCLSIAGVLMQTFFRNPLADPYVLGISSGSALMMAIYTMLFYSISYFYDYLYNLSVPFIAGFGAVVYMFFILLVSYRIKNEVSLLIVGILLATLTNSIIAIIQSTALSDKLRSFIIWNFSSLSAATLSQGLFLLLLSLVVLFVLYKNSTSLDIWLLGTEQAQLTGLNIKSFRIFILFITSILIGLSTSFYGPISFIGLIIPHLSRLIFKQNIHKILLISSALLGCIFMLVADILSQLFIIFTKSQSLPLNSIISLLALPILVSIILKRKELWN